MNTSSLNNQKAEIKPFTYKNKNGQTVLCDYSGVPYTGLRHRLHRNEATNDCDITIDIFAHRQIGAGWRLLCVEYDHNEGKTRASYIGEFFKSLNEILSNATENVEKTGYL
jgi:hypothetical protein